MAAVATRVIPWLMLLLSLRPVHTNDLYLKLQPEGNSVRRGENATFSCFRNATNTNINGTEYVGLYRHNSTNGTFQLLGQIYEFVHENVFNVLDIGNDDEGTYICRLNSSDGYIGLIDSNSVNLTIAYLEKPELNASRRYLSIGDTVDFECSKPSGNPPPNLYSWFRNGSLWNSTASDDETISMRLLIKSVNDSGSYQCRAESQSYGGSSGIYSNEVVIQVLEVIPVTSETEANEGDRNVVLKCEIKPIVDGINGSQWTKLTNTTDYDIIQDKTNKYVVTHSVGEFNLNISTVDRNDSAMYRCHFISPGLDSFTADVQLTVNYIDTPDVHSDIKSGLKRGQSANITCVTSGAKPPVNAITWFRNDQPITATGNSEQYDVSEGGQLLTLVSFTEADEGVYKCRAESEVFPGISGKTSSSSCQLYLIYLNEPQIKMSPNEINIGETVKLTCFLPDGNPSPNEVVWLKDGQQINNATIKEDDIINGNVTREIEIVNTEANGEYSCRVLSDAYQQENGKESNTQTISVIEKDEEKENKERLDLGNERLDIYLIIAVLVALVGLIAIILFVYICCFKSIHLVVLEQQITDAKASLIVECHYRPRLARAKSVQWVTPNGSLPLMKFPSCINTLTERKYLKEIPSDDKIELQAANIDRLKVASNGRGTLYLEISGVTAFDSGEYTCSVRRHNGKKIPTHSGIMTVHSKLIIVAGEAFANVESLTISCMCLPCNEPVDSFIWFRADETGDVRQGHGSALASSTDNSSRGRYSCACEANTSYLRISEPTEEDAGNYHCKVIRKYDSIPFYGVIVLAKDGHTLEWKVSQFKLQGLPQEANKTDTSLSGEPIPSEDAICTGDKEVERMNSESYEVNDESIQNTNLAANGAVNGGDELDVVVDVGENSALLTDTNRHGQPNINGGDDNDRCGGNDDDDNGADNDDNDGRPTENDDNDGRPTDNDDNDGRPNDDDDDDDDDDNDHHHHGGGTDNDDNDGNDDHDHDGGTNNDDGETENSSNNRKSMDVQLEHPGTEWCEQRNEQINPEENIKADCGISSDIDEQLKPQGVAEEDTGIDVLEAQTENVYNNGESSVHGNKEQKQVENTDDDELVVNENGDIDGRLDLQSNIEEPANSDAHLINENPAIIQNSNLQSNTEKDVGNSD